MTDSLQENLDSLFLAREKTLTFFKGNAECLRPFSSNSGISIFPRLDKHKEFHATSTGFCLFYLSNLLLKRQNALYPGLVNNLVTDIKAHSESVAKHFYKQHIEKGKSAVGPLPNYYNSTLQIAGLLTSNIVTKQEIQSNVRNYVSQLIDGPSQPDINWKSLKQTLVENRGFIHRMDDDNESVPSPYLTFWALEALASYDTIYKTQHTKDIYSLIYTWSLDGISKSIAYSYSGLPQAFDVIEVSYLLLILLRLQESDLEGYGSLLSKPKRVIEHAIDLIFLKYFSNGCFSKSLPVLANTRGYSLSCPTTEPISLLLVRYPEYFLGLNDKLQQIYDWIEDNKSIDTETNTNLWRSEWEHPSSRPTSFMSVVVFSFLAAYYNFLDILLTQKAAKLLGVIPFLKDPDVEKIGYPGDLGNIINNYVVEPIKAGKKDLAHYSIILFGPPGTSKTTISKKIAQDLEWPLLVINTNLFLKSGMEKIDSEADRLFRLASYLNKVVVLFDEVEELVLKRDVTEKNAPPDQKSRFLTTSMLPRINDLRNTSRVVFIFATNYINHIDPAIVRTGRFDCVHCVMPPNEEERKHILKSLVQKYSESKPDEILAQLLSAGTLSRLKRFCYADLRDLVRRIVVNVNNTQRAIDQIVDIEVQTGEHAVMKQEDYEEFLRKKQELDRPKKVSNE